jgi:hypothetical protein|tara:strand:- start:367 stop:912 length:546 start_codon:yes stop_codon:yes gene_type:complete
MFTHEYYDWTGLINGPSRLRMISDIDKLIANGDYWTNSPPYQTNVNIFGLQTQDWINLKMSFIWSCFAYMQREAQIKSVKSWGYQTSLKTTEDRERYWHQHLREGSQVISGVYYLALPDSVCGEFETSGTEIAPNGVDGDGKFYAPWKSGQWMIMPGKTWHRPGKLHSNENRYIVAADMEI